LKHFSHRVQFITKKCAENCSFLEKKLKLLNLTCLFQTKMLVQRVFCLDRCHCKLKTGIEQQLITLYTN
jgi:hypothetical protein